jgi:hypothetical protein
MESASSAILLHDPLQDPGASQLILSSGMCVVVDAKLAKRRKYKHPLRVTIQTLSCKMSEDSRNPTGTIIAGRLVWLGWRIMYVLLFMHPPATTHHSHFRNLRQSYFLPRAMSHNQDYLCRDVSQNYGSHGRCCRLEAIATERYVADGVA